MINPPTQHLPYSHAPTKMEQERKHTRFLNIFRRLQVNIPLAEALEHMPTYIKFMKEILTKKQRIMDEEIIQVDASCSVVIQKALPQKEIDPGRVMLPITVGNVNVGKALIDLGSSINLIPLSTVKKMTLQLADKSITGHQE